MKRGGIQRQQLLLGRVGYRLEPTGNAVVATISLPPKIIPTVYLRLRHPDGRKLKQVSLGKLVDSETIALPAGSRGQLKLVARFA